MKLLPICFFTGSITVSAFVNVNVFCELYRKIAFVSDWQNLGIVKEKLLPIFCGVYFLLLLRIAAN